MVAPAGRPRIDPWQPTRAADGPAAQEILRSETWIDLPIGDVGLPGGMNGRQPADAAHQNRPALKVRFITGYAEQAVLGSGQVEQGMQVMTKPFALNAIAGRIEDILTAG